MIFSSHFFPCLAYFSSIINEKEIKINITEQYHKQSYKNRANILGPHKIESLIVPVLKNRNNAPVKDIQIDYKDNWQRIMWKTIETNYKKAPYFEFYDYLIKPIFEFKPNLLVELNDIALKKILELLGLNLTILNNSYSFHDFQHEFVIFELKKEYYKIENFNNIEYRQNFGKEFVPNLSILDLLFCKGPESVDLLNKCRIF